ncbi:radical SAM/Cys-rich domain-containing protein [Trichlorobacter thiogenes]|uniref:Radical SAM/Cys-rich domain-containing protein n=1 Tax=Trichlorobacter thiogenes TaxID=115783 RepID=A0A1T4KT62_9BACT|nr:arsenosugar biosynthesis radical SAM (seleno)protein ArsS [Trichlorobacter thiogenes]SJZ45634.1 radical SAM/Cys-rich domain-containing protein [Trichlorobacter thiogenes]
MTFKEVLHAHGLNLARSDTKWLQVNVGLACDLHCKHCHLEAGPARTELMELKTVEEVIACAGRFSFDTIDITGGAPELMPHLPRLVIGLASLTPKLVVRTNLVALSRSESEKLIELYVQNHVSIVASLPSLSSSQTDAMRGEGACKTSIGVLQQLNSVGYGIEGSGLYIDIAANPTGAFLPVTQGPAEERFRKELHRKYGISFNKLLTFANVPLGRFRTWLERSGNLDDYLLKLKERFNPSTISGLMCSSLISINWDGYLYDCDFNLAAELPHQGKRKHISSFTELPQWGTPIAVGDHCFACTAGAGFTCGGSISV